jgi:hypothetical protein
MILTTIPFLLKLPEQRDHNVMVNGFFSCRGRNNKLLRNSCRPTISINNNALMYVNIMFSCDCSDMQNSCKADMSEGASKMTDQFFKSYLKFRKKKLQFLSIEVVKKMHSEVFLLNVRYINCLPPLTNHDVKL